MSMRWHRLQALNNLAVIYTSQGKAQEALQLLQAAIGANQRYAGACPQQHACSPGPAESMAACAHPGIFLSHGIPLSPRRSLEQPRRAAA
jgi:hypothetical protein